MAQKLSQRAALNGNSLPTDDIHAVRGGLSYKMPLSVAFRNGTIPFRSAVGDAEILISRKDPLNAPSSVFYVDDIVFYMDNVNDIMIIGLCKATCSTFPADLRDNTKFTRFYDGTAVL